MVTDCETTQGLVYWILSRFVLRHLRLSVSLHTPLSPLYLSVTPLTLHADPPRVVMVTAVSLRSCR